jgi:GT2 family glycosyltransferase
MLANKEKILKIGMFDINIFLYAEELDLCKRLRLNNEKIYINKTAKVFHMAAKSSNIGFEFDKCRNWHWMWSKVYFEKKYHNHFLVYNKFIILLFIQLLKIIFYGILLKKKEVINKTMRFSGILNSLLGKKSWYRPKFNSD